MRIPWHRQPHVHKWERIPHPIWMAEIAGAFPSILPEVNYECECGTLLMQTFTHGASCAVPSLER